MERELVARWCAALRSYNYHQGGGALRTPGGYGYPPRFCALGVLANVIDPKGWVTDSSWKGWVSRLPDDVLPHPIQTRITELNDRDRLTFHEIADEIEKLADGGEL